MKGKFGFHRMRYKIFDNIKGLCYQSIKSEIPLGTLCPIIHRLAQNPIEEQVWRQVRVLVRDCCSREAMYGE